APAVVSIRVREADSPASAHGQSNPSENDFEDGPPRLFKQRADQSKPPKPLRPSKPAEPPEPSQPALALGSGFFISSDGYVVSNDRGVDSATDFVVTTQDQAEHRARLVGADNKTDIALLKVTADNPFPYVKFSGADIRVGQW